jgi:hypothetical protein
MPTPRSRRRVLTACLVLAAALMLTAAPAPAKLVHFKELLPFVDMQLDGWQPQGKPQGSTLQSGQMEMSQASATFRSGGKILEIQVGDGLPAQFASLGASKGFQFETTENYLKQVEVDGFQGMESFHFQEKKGDLLLNVADRFLVVIKVHGADKGDILTTVAKKMDLKKLAELAN